MTAGRKIPRGLPYTLRELNDAVRKASNTVFELHIESAPEAFDQAADELYAAFAVARELSRPGNVTGCAEHPQGAVDPLPPAGWGRCLICNGRRHRARRDAQGR